MFQTRLGRAAGAGDGADAVAFGARLGEPVDAVLVRPLARRDRRPEHRREHRPERREVARHAAGDELREVGHPPALDERADDLPVGRVPADQQHLLGEAIGMRFGHPSGRERTPPGRRAGPTQLSYRSARQAVPAAQQEQRRPAPAAPARRVRAPRRRRSGRRCPRRRSRSPGRSGRGVGDVDADPAVMLPARRRPTGTARRGTGGCRSMLSTVKLPVPSPLVFERGVVRVAEGRAGADDRAGGRAAGLRRSPPAT